MNLSAVGKSINIDDSWTESARSYDPTTEELISVSDVPATGTHYGQELWVASRQRVMVWTEGFADIVARTKAEDLTNVLKTSDVRSGFAFRNRRNKE